MKASESYLILCQLENGELTVKQAHEKILDLFDVPHNYFDAVIYPSFNDFWELYGKKRGKEITEKKWNKLKQKDKEAIMEHLPQYIISTPDIQFRKDPATYLNQKSWNDEIIKPKQTDLSYRQLWT
jgi:hypothetical protein